MTAAHSHDAARLDALEIRISHQDETIAELNEMVTAQWTTLDALTRQVKRLREEIQNMAPQRDGPEAPPPHY